MKFVELYPIGTRYKGRGSICWWTLLAYTTDNLNMIVIDSIEDLEVEVKTINSILYNNPEFVETPKRGNFNLLYQKLQS